MTLTWIDRLRIDYRRIESKAKRLERENIKLKQENYKLRHTHSGATGIGDSPSGRNLDAGLKKAVKHQVPTYTARSLESARVSPATERGLLVCVSMKASAE